MSGKAGTALRCPRGRKGDNVQVSLRYESPDQALRQLMALGIQQMTQHLGSWRWGLEKEVSVICRESRRGRSFNFLVNTKGV